MLEDSTLALAIVSYHFLHVLNLGPFLKLFLLNVLLIFLLYINIMLQWEKSLKTGVQSPTMYMHITLVKSNFYLFFYVYIFENRKF